jgi:hypothetical protein
MIVLASGQLRQSAVLCCFELTFHGVTDRRVFIVSRDDVRRLFFTTEALPRDFSTEENRQPIVKRTVKTVTAEKLKMRRDISFFDHGRHLDT